MGKKTPKYIVLNKNFGDVYEIVRTAPLVEREEIR